MIEKGRKFDALIYGGVVLTYMITLQAIAFIWKGAGIPGFAAAIPIGLSLFSVYITGNVVQKRGEQKKGGGNGG